jgi:hypothetical protein
MSAKPMTRKAWLAYLHKAVDEFDWSTVEQEPVAVYGYCPECGAKGVMRERRPDGNDKCANGHTYPSCKAAHPPQRTWVGLTDEEIDKAWRSVDYTVPWEQHRIDIAKAIEAKLKQKNGFAEENT